MSNNTAFDPNDPTLPANLPPELRRIDSHLKDDGRYWQAHLPSEERLHQQARTMAFNTASNTANRRRGLPFRTFAGISSTAVVVGLLAALFVVLAYNRGHQKPPIAKATATSIPTPSAPLSAYFVTFIPNSSDPHPNCCNVIHALNASNGQQRWQRQLDTPSIPGAPSSFKPELPHVFEPTIVGDGKLFILAGTSSTILYALRTSDGKLLWQKSLLQDVVWAVYENGVIYTGSFSVGTDPAFADAYRASDGKLLWEHSSASCAVEAEDDPRAADANAVYVAESCASSNTTSQDTLIALRASDGSQIWSYPISTGGVAKSTLVNGVLYIVDINSGITALRASDGTQVWHVQEGALTLDNGSGALEAIQGTIYVTYNHNSIYHLYALRASDGHLLWSKQFPSAVDWLAAANGVVYYAINTNLFALNATNGTQIWHLAEPLTVYYPIAADNALYFMVSPDYSFSSFTIYDVRPTNGNTAWRYDSSHGGSLLTVG